MYARKLQPSSVFKFGVASILTLALISGIFTMRAVSQNTSRVDSPLAGNWLLVGSMQNSWDSSSAGIADQFHKANGEGTDIAAAATFDMDGKEINAAVSWVAICPGNLSASGSDVLSGKLKNGRFSLKTQNSAIGKSAIVVELDGDVPIEKAPSWDGRLSVAMSNGPCAGTLSNEIHASAVPLLVGPFTSSSVEPGNGTFQPLNVDLSLNQTPDLKPSVASIRIESPACHVSGTSSDVLVHGGLITGDFVLDDGSHMRAQGSNGSLRDTKLRMWFTGKSLKNCLPMTTVEGFMVSLVKSN
jgi:hypothetical protein